MNLSDYALARKADPNAFWRLEPGDADNLLDEALEKLDAYERERASMLASVRAWTERHRQAVARVREAEAVLTELVDAATEGTTDRFLGVIGRARRLLSR